MSNTTIDMREQALALVDAGMWVFPLKARSKQPATLNGLKDASNDPVLVANMFAARWDGAEIDRNIGIDCGRSGLLVVDLDGDAGMSQRGLFPETLTALTGKGAHLYYSGEGRSTVRALGDGIDTRGVGGYVVAPPSVHPDGHRYQWEDPEVPIAPAPGWVLSRLKPRKPQKRRRKPDAQTATVLLWAAVQRFRAATPGTRNDALNREAYFSRDLEQHSYLALLWVAEGEAIGLGHQECVRTVASALGRSVEDVEGWL